VKSLIFMGTSIRISNMSEGRDYFVCGLCLLLFFTARSCCPANILCRLLVVCGDFATHQESPSKLLP
jgi:hypothetical protein